MAASRIRRKRVRELERLVAESCRLYATRPTRGREPDNYEPIARSFLMLNIWMAADQASRFGPLCSYWARAVAVNAVNDETAGIVDAQGVVTWSRTVEGVEQDTEAPFTLSCRIASTPRGAKRTPITLRFAEIGR